jgi:hypothetical protein
VGSNRDSLVPAAGTFTEMRAKTVTTQPANGSLVCTLFVNNAATSLVLTIAANATAGIYTSTGSAVVTANDDARVGCTNNSADTASANIRNLNVKFAY